MEVKLQIERFFLSLRNDSIVLASALVSEGEKEIKIEFDKVNINLSQNEKQLSEIENHIHDNVNNNQGEEQTNDVDNLNLINLTNAINDELIKEKSDLSSPMQMKNKRRQGIKIDVSHIKAALRSESDAPESSTPNFPESQDSSRSETIIEDEPQLTPSREGSSSCQNSESLSYTVKEIAQIYNLDLDSMVQQLLSGDADQVYSVIESLHFQYRAIMYEHLKQMLADMVPS